MVPSRHRGQLWTTCSCRNPQLLRHGHRQFVETLLARGGEADLQEAETAIERLASSPLDPGLVLREIWLLRLRALLADARGDEVRLSRSQPATSRDGHVGLLGWDIWRWPIRGLSALRRQAQAEDCLFRRKSPESGWTKLIRWSTRAGRRTKSDPTWSPEISPDGHGNHQLVSALRLSFSRVSSTTDLRRRQTDLAIATVG